MDTETEDKEDDLSEADTDFEMIPYEDTATASDSTFHMPTPSVP